MRGKKVLYIIIVIMIILCGNKCPVMAKESKNIYKDFQYEKYEYTTDKGKRKEYIYIAKYVGSKKAREIVIPNTIKGTPVETLGENLFAGMKNLQKVTIPANVRTISKGVFKDCVSLTTVKGIQGDVEYNLNSATITTTFADTPWYQNKVKKSGTGVIMIGTTVYDMTHCSGEVKIPEGATGIASTAYGNKFDKKKGKTNLNITSIYIPKTLKKISYFERIAGLEKLKSITVHKNNKYFYSKNGILYMRYTPGANNSGNMELLVYPAQKKGTSFKVPANVKRIRGVRSQYLTTVTFASNYKKHDEVDLINYAFLGCKNLKKITLPTYCHLSNSVFKGTGLTELYLPKGVIYNSGGAAFLGMSKLKKVSVHKKHPCLVVENGALMQVYEGKELLLYPPAKEGTSFRIPVGTTSVYTMDEAKNLKTLIVPKSVKNFGLANSRMQNISIIKYCGTKQQWKNIRMAGYVDAVDEPMTIEEIKKCNTKFTVYYNCGSLNNAKISIPNNIYKYTGKSIKPTVTVKVCGIKLKKGTHYTVTYKNNKKIGKATITITGKGKYYGMCKKTFQIVKKK